jgi:hypothetical protein
MLDAELSECIEDRIAALGNNVPPHRGDFGGELGVAHSARSCRAAFNDNRRIGAAGVGHSELSPEGRERLEGLLATYVGRLRPGHAEIRYAEAKRHLSETHFAWIGHFDDASPFYYRVQSPVILVEFDHQSGIVFDNDTPSRDHIHTVVRTPNGNDYGKDPAAPTLCRARPLASRDGASPG